LNASKRTRRELPSAGFDLSLGKKTKKRIKELTMVNVRCQACQVKYRLLAAKRLNLLGLALEARPQKPTPRFPYRPPIQRRPRSYIIQPASLVYLKNTHKFQLSIFSTICLTILLTKKHTHTVDKRSFLFLRTREPCVCVCALYQPTITNTKKKKNFRAGPQAKKKNKEN
jgi:hypothetical protein